MSLYQKSVLNKHLKGLNQDTVNKAWEIYKDHFHNSTIQQNIRNSKEEQYQGEFLIDLFVKVFGYIKNPNPDFNLTTELKNIKGAKKTDGAILKDDKALAVIELKGTKITDLNKVEAQAFGYKNNHPECVYVITSNFEKLRFYIDNAVEYEEFNLFNLIKERFDVLWLCLASESLLKDIPKKAKDDSLTQEEMVTKKLYKDYASFRNDIYQSIVSSNPEYDKLTLFKKTQKLLDRFLFIFFAEDRLLLPPNSIREIINQWTTLRDELDAYVPLYDRFKKYFGYLNTGHKGKQHDIFAYNGGLFAEDEILNNIKIDDPLLYTHTQNLSNYDFESEVSVNILGHIFEHSLNDIEEIQAEIEGTQTDKSKTKRKKDGVFYTPKYITKYIVDNTVGKLCEEKKTELGINDEDYEKERKGRKKSKIKELNDKIETYRKWLLQITICDPACGSGAFLNQALEFLIKEHQYIDELQTKLLGGDLVLPNIENIILENNLFGVDINNESVEIAKLSLWLRTAKQGRKLTSLNDNIKCGNSLIDDPEVAGEKAFHWESEFPEVFAKDGFDVVIGNPPYGAKLGDKIKVHLTSNYKCFKSNFDIYSSFIELAFILCKSNSYWGFINPVSWQSGKHYLGVRKYLVENGMLEIGIKLPYNVFSDAYVDTGVYIFKKRKSENYKSLVYEFPVSYKNLNDLSTEAYLIPLNNNEWVKLESLKIVLNPSFYTISPKVNRDSILLSEVSKSIRGILANKEDIRDSIIDNLKPYYIGGLYRYIYSDDYCGVNYGEHLKEKPKDYSFFQGERILIRRLINRRFRVMAAYTEKEFVNKKDLYNLKLTNNNFTLKYVLAIINSQLISYLKTKGSTTATKDDFGQLTLTDVRKIPIKLIPMQSQLNFVSKVDMISANKIYFDKLLYSLQKYIQSFYYLDKLSKKLQNWFELEFGDFIKELNKAIKKAGSSKLTKTDEIEWMEIFSTKKIEIQKLKTAIDQTDREIDQMVYELYGLTEEEIRIVEEATN